jgi:hypothetical protein
MTSLWSFFEPSRDLHGLHNMAKPGDLHMFRVQTPSFLISSFEVDNQAEVCYLKQTILIHQYDFENVCTSI